VSLTLAACAPYYSTDGGVNWTVFPQGFPYTGPPKDNSNYTLPNGTYIDSFGNNSVGLTFCYGPQPPPNGTWTKCSSGIPSNGIAGFITTKFGGNVIGMLAGLPGSLGCGFVQTANNASTWTTANNGLPFTSGQPSNCGYPNFFGITTDNRGFVYAIEGGGNVWKITSPQ
jgi:hypothetical protein